MAPPSPPQRRIVIFGASTGGERALRSLSRPLVAVAFCDNDRGKRGTEFHSLPVVGPDELGSLPHDRVLIASRYYADIFNQLVDLGVAPERIDILDDDILHGVDEPSRIIYWAIAGVIAILTLAGYGLLRLIVG